MSTVSLLPEGYLLANRYEIQRVIGQGGMGIVYLAKDKQLEDELRAIKTIKPELINDPKGAKQLRQEAIAAQRLAHPNIIRVFRYDNSDGIHFIEMEYVDGKTLGQILADKERLTEEEFYPLARQLCDGLAFAHQQGVIHQDIKPGNIFVDSSERARIADFGIARVVKDTNTRLTGQLPSGTLVYMSPELIRGKKPSVASDVYSLAILFYEMLSGEAPFVRGDITWQHQNETPEPMKGISESLNHAILMGLHKEPEKRPPVTVYWEIIGRNYSLFKPIVIPSKTEDHAIGQVESTKLAESITQPEPEKIYHCKVCGKKLRSVSDDYRKCPKCGKYVCPEHFDLDKLLCAGCVPKPRAKKNNLSLWIFGLLSLPSVYFLVAAFFYYQNSYALSSNRFFIEFPTLVVLPVLIIVYFFRKLFRKIKARKANRSE